MEATASEQAQGLIALLRRLRKEQGYDQTQIAARIGVSSYTLGRWEGGKGFPQLPEAIEWAKIFGVDLSPIESPLGAVSPTLSPSSISFDLPIGVVSLDVAREARGRADVIRLPVRTAG